MSEAQSIQWDPGHMAKTKRKIEQDLKLVDAVAELVDARVPVSSRNPLLATLIENKPRIILLNKSDMADAAETARWIAAYKQEGAWALAVDCKSGKGVNGFVPLVREALKDRIAQWEAKGMAGRAIRIMVVGIPNVGKSSLINKLTRGGKAEVEDRPGVTRQNRWFRVGKGMDLLDTPGVLWPKFEDPIAGERLAFTGAVRDDILDVEWLAMRLLELLAAEYPQALRQRYKFEELPQPLEGAALLELVGRKRGMLVSGGEVDTLRAATMLLDEFRAGKLGRITLEKAGR